MGNENMPAALYSASFRPLRVEEPTEVLLAIRLDTEKNIILTVTPRMHTKLCFLLCSALITIVGVSRRSYSFRTSL